MPPDGAVACDSPETTYAHAVHVGRIEDLPKTRERLSSEWLPSARYGHSGIADIERSDDRFSHAEADQLSLQTKNTFIGSCGSSFTSTLPNPARVSIDCARSTPQQAPRPAPPCASETVMQCMHEIV